MDETPLPALPGEIMMVLLLAAALAYPLARLLLWRYVQAVEQSMRSVAAPTAAEAPPVAATPRVVFAGTRAALKQQLQRAPWRSAAIQMGVAVLLGVYFAVLRLQAGDMDMSVYRIIALTATYAWPGALAVMLIAGISRRQRMVVLLIGAGLYLAFGVWAHTGSFGEALWDIVVLWSFTNLPATLYLLAFMTRRVRAVGPLVLLVTLATVGGVVGIFSLWLVFPDAGFALAGMLVDAGLGSTGVLALAALVGGALALVVGLWLLRRLVRAYEHYNVGDEGLAVAAVWLVFILMNSIILVFSGPGYFVLGLAAFPVYLICVRAAREQLLPTTGDAPALLLLRVFSRKGPTAGLFRAVNRHWRHVGPIRMIAGYDLAPHTISPDGMMAFLRKRLSDRFITAPDVVQRRLSERAPQRDADARYRSEEFFCFDNTWRDTLHRLVANSAVVLMDLRGFSAANKGCIFELEALHTFGALPRTVLLHDATSDMPVLMGELMMLGVDASALNLLATQGDEARDIDALLTALSERAVVG